MSDGFSLISEEELRVQLAQWMIKHCRFAPQPGGCAQAAFVNNFPIPKTVFHPSCEAVGNGDNVLSVLKTTVALQSWQTRCGNEKSFVYCKAFEHEVDSMGNVFSSVCGYGVISAD